MKAKMSAFEALKWGSQTRKANKRNRSDQTDVRDQSLASEKSKRTLKRTSRTAHRTSTPYRVSRKKSKSSLSSNLDQNALSPKGAKNKVELPAVRVEPAFSAPTNGADVPRLEERNKKEPRNWTVEARAATSPGTINGATSGRDSAACKGTNAVETVVVPREPPYMFDSRVEGEKCFEWLIHPEEKDKFFDELWGKIPLIVKRHNNNYFKGLFSTDVLDEMLRERNVWFGKNIDITSYENGKRETHNLPGRALPAVVWNYYQNGCSVRLLNPQTFNRSVWRLNATLQDFFGSFVGANVYLTPPGSQGFAPHYDDIEGFVLQLEGKKRWKLYNPRYLAETLPRFSSANFDQKDIGEPIIDAELEAGDLLYLPRGFIHQASTLPNVHSLHITVSTHQRNTWGDFFEKLVPAAVQLAFEENLGFRQSLPRDFMQFVGVANSDKKDPQRTAFLEKVQKLMLKLTQYLPIDATADQMAKGYIHDCLPPLLTKREKARSIHGSGERWCEGKVTGSVELHPDSRVKLLRANLARLVMEENVVRVYHSLENSRAFHEEEPQFVEISPMLAPAVEHLMNSYPSFVTVEDFPLKTLEDKMTIANLLYDKGLIMSESVEDVGD